MKKYLSVILLLLVSACGKQEDVQPQWDSTQSYTVEGYLYSKQIYSPVVGRTIAISQERRKYSHSDPQATTDSNGYFKLDYVPKGSKDGLNVYPVLQDYSCVGEISFITNIPKGKNVNLKKVYSHHY